jgi:hypothetical protein
LEAELSGVDEDVVVTDETQSSADVKWTVPSMRSEPTNKVFIEQKSKIYIFIHSTDEGIQLQHL